MIYHCPMHPEVTSEKPGVCHKCGSMKLVPKTTETPALKSKIVAYKPLIIIVGMITLVTLVLMLKDFQSGMFMWEDVMANFMAGFFLVFAGFKLLDLKGFADAYATYDILAKRVHGYGYVYPFIELGLGLLFLVGNESTPLLVATLALMTFSGLGVLQKLAAKEEVHCACLGTLIKVPLTSVALVEDFGMAVMTLAMLAVRF
jgi:hypothetical protein